MAKAKKLTQYKKYKGTIVECKSGRYLAYYEHRRDIVANGDNEVEAKKRLNKLYETVMKLEKKEEEKNEERPLPKDFKTKPFTDKIRVLS